MIHLGNLRVWNYYADDGGKWRRVQRRHMVGSDYGHRIPLTDEIIKNAGLHKRRTKNGIFVHYIAKYKSFGLCIRNTGNIIGLIKYVDQVQNFYHATTGEEIDMFRNVPKAKLKENLQITFSEVKPIPKQQPQETASKVVNKPTFFQKLRNLFR